MTMPLAQQVIVALSATVRYGDSRHAAKLAGSASQLTFSGRTFTTHRDRIMAALNWIVTHRRPELTILRAISHADWHAYMAHANATLHGDSPHATLAALRKLEHGMRARRWWSSPDPYLPPDLHATTPRSAPRVGFTRDEAVTIIAHLDGDAQRAATLALCGGLRIHEIVALRHADLDLNHGTIHVARGKGGRARLVTWLCEPQRLADLRSGTGYFFAHIHTGAEADTFIRQIEAAVATARDACGILGSGRNMHCFRSCYAAQYLQHLIAEQQLDETTARFLLARQLGHNRVSVTYRYVPPVQVISDGISAASARHEHIR